ncbi:MAG: hypothetical protein OD817_04730 [Gammaproteobacteria bacterium]
MSARLFTPPVRRVLAAQAALALAVMALALAATALHAGMAALPALGLMRAKAAAFGALLGMLATLVTARSVLQSAKAAEHAAGMAILPVYAGLLMKLLLVAGGAFAGLVWLQLGPLFVLLGYITMQAGYFWAGGETRRP